MLNDVLSRLRSLNCDRSDIDELVALLALAEPIRDSYVASGLVIPEWLIDATTQLKREIADRRRDSLLHEKKLLQAQRRKIRTRDEVRAEVDAREAEIDKLLGVATAPAAVANE